MKITIDINGQDYSFEMNRMTYKRLLADKEYAEMQNSLAKRFKSKNNKDLSEEEVKGQLLESDATELILQNLVMEEQLFHYCLLMHQPDMTKQQSSDLLDIAIDEYGREEVDGLCRKVMENFTQRGEEPKKKMNMRMG